MEKFNGSDYKPERDDARLTSQLSRVFNCLVGGKWLPLHEIADRTGDPEASVSAQLRHLRKPKHGAHTVNKRHVKNGLYEYQLIAANA